MMTPLECVAIRVPLYRVSQLSKSQSHRQYSYNFSCPSGPLASGKSHFYNRQSLAPSLEYLRIRKKEEPGLYKDA